MPMVVILSIPEIFCRVFSGHKDRAVILGAGPFQDSHHLELDVLFGDQDHVPDFALLQFGRLVSHDRLAGRSPG